MNERIQQLAEQAWYYQVRIFNDSDGTRTYSEKEKVFDKEKFAELIVRECVGIADEYDGVGSTIVSRIKKHFGVEE